MWPANQKELPTPGLRQPFLVISLATSLIKYKSCTQGSRLRFIDDLIDSDTKCKCDAMCVTFTGKAWRFSLEVKYWTQRLVTAWASPNGGRYMLCEKQVLSRRSNSFLWRNRNRCKALFKQDISAHNIEIKDKKIKRYCNKNIFLSHGFQWLT